MIMRQLKHIYDWKWKRDTQHSTTPRSHKLTRATSAGHNIFIPRKELQGSDKTSWVSEKKEGKEIKAGKNVAGTPTPLSTPLCHVLTSINNIEIVNKKQRRKCHLDHDFRWILPRRKDMAGIYHLHQKNESSKFCSSSEQFIRRYKRKKREMPSQCPKGTAGLNS